MNIMECRNCLQTNIWTYGLMIGCQADLYIEDNKMHLLGFLLGSKVSIEEEFH